LLKKINSLDYIYERKQNMLLRKFHLKMRTKIILVLLSLAILALSIFFDYPKDKDKTKYE
jgi:hypothetical protein